MIQQVLILSQNVHDIQVLPLVFVQTLYLYVEDAVRVQKDTALLFNILCEAFLVFLLDFPQLFQNSLVIFKDIELFQFAAVYQELVANLFPQQLGQTRIGLIQPSSVSNTIGNVLELVRGIQIFIMENRFLDDFGVQLRNAVDAVRSHYTQSCHVNLIVLDDGHSGGLCTVAAVAFHQACTVTVVDFYDNLEDSRNNLLYKVDIPLFQSFCHNGVVGVSKGVGNDVPSVIPSITAVIQQNPHQFRNGEGRVGVVDVDGNLFVQVIQCAVYAHVVVYDVTDGSSTQEVLLTQTQGLSFEVVVVRIQNLRNCICHGVLAQCTCIVPFVEGLHIKARSFCLPQTQSRNAFTAVTRNIQVVRNCQYGVVVVVREVVIGILPVFLNFAFKVYFNGFIRLRVEPYRAARQPVVREFRLPAVLEFLTEDTVFIADGMTGCRNALCCHCIQIASSQSAQTAVTQTSIRFLFINLVDVDVIIIQDGSHIVYQFEVV